MRLDRKTTSSWSNGISRSTADEDCKSRWLIRVGATSVLVVLSTANAFAQSKSAVNVCADLGVQLPGLRATTSATASVGLPAVDAALRGIASEVDENVVAPLSNAGLRLGQIDADGKVAPVSRTNCTVEASRVALNSSKGISLGGGRMDGLGSGQVAVASDASAIALGNDTKATGTAALGIGAGTRATGAASIALGLRGTASGEDSVAIGAGASANHANSVAIGAGAETTRANQVAIGRSSQTYTLAGVTSAQSRSAQSGPTQFVTTDASGNLATTSYGPSDLGGLSNRISSLEDGLNGLTHYAVDSRREARQGIAAAMAMTSASMPSLPGKTTWALNTATFKGEWAGGAAVAHRLDMPVPIAATAGFSYSDTSKQGARVGLASEF